ncbi:hypothetical protein M419DRAFT_133281 [Trichoderma reesei RUT C-30]|uniref:Uncharacterized protein n=1 Tax=Hypocrea jecorina (strain ATCC 56765 / BCRC 32924 / NRRL 11460 / Rut C-30) TaxID=1344414 RepID=A0A024RZS2_HYPJR|nr:hypothetical protein M419DRAFT_133281 [Trichoderma reesei RUT C-30]
MSTPFEFQILEAHAKYDSTYKHSGLECPPLRKAVNVTCMDYRLNPKSAYGFELRRKEVVHGIMTKNLGLTESKDVDDFGVMIFLELGESTREEVEGLRSHPVAWKKVRVTGRIHDTDTELLRKIVE